MEFPGLPSHDSLKDFDCVFLGIPVKDCILGILLTCPMITSPPPEPRCAFPTLHFADPLTQHRHDTAHH